jgi:hypothetical protein
VLARPPGSHHGRASRRVGALTRCSGGVRDANGQALVYIYSRDSEAEAMQAKVFTKDEARRIAINVAGQA